jgi:hypothetical protein
MEGEFVERCMYRLAIEDPDNTMGQGMVEAVERYEKGGEIVSPRKFRCVRECGEGKPDGERGTREDAEGVGCLLYRAPLPDGDATIRRGVGFVSEKWYRAIEKQGEERKALEKELSELEGVAKLGALGEGGFIRIKELKDILGK